jgi:hypothetical protein
LDSEQDSDQYRKPHDVAAQLDVTVRTVRAWMAAGKLPSVEACEGHRPPE